MKNLDSYKSYLKMRLFASLTPPRCPSGGSDITPYNRTMFSAPINLRVALRLSKTNLAHSTMAL